MPYFINTYIEIWEPYLSKEKSEITNDKMIKYDLTATIPADLQGLTPSYSQQEYGKILEDTYSVYIDSTVTISPNAILREEGKTDTYMIKGTPVLNNHLLPHIKLVIEKQRTPTKLE